MKEYYSNVIIVHVCLFWSYCDGICWLIIRQTLFILLFLPIKNIQVGVISRQLWHLIIFLNIFVSYSYFFIHFEFIHFEFLSMGVSENVILIKTYFENWAMLFRMKTRNIDFDSFVVAKSPLPIKFQCSYTWTCWTKMKLYWSITYHKKEYWADTQYLLQDLAYI